MASSSRPKRTYDVFLSFRGSDVRNNFLGHLYRALDQNGIYTFFDDEELKKGNQISPELMQAIDESCIAIIIFSENYAFSRWCLKELAKIMECKEHKNLTVLPVFFRVDPKEVRQGRASYGKAMATHDSKLGNDPEEVRRWKEALFDAGSLSGWHLKDGGDESELIQSIVRKISTCLGRTLLHVAKHPVGIVYRVAKLKSMLNLEFNNDVVTVGLWGQGGIGKTTSVKALYNSIHTQFEGSCFLANVRETSKGDNGLAALQETLLNDILLPRQRLKVSNKDRGITLIQQRLCRQKVLIILDDVDDLCQLDALAGEDNWFGDGSRIIVTTRDKHVLNCRKIDEDHVYEVEFLDGNEALELLRRHAFRTPQQSNIREDLVDAIVNYAGGLPLALEVLGSFLHEKRENVWESTLKKLSRLPKNEINSVLKISYDRLEEDEKDIFLHIVCFFKGKHSNYVKKVIDSCDLAATAGLEVLIDRSLISMTEYGDINVHDLIQAMGMEIVRQECCDDPMKRSRLWQYDDVVNVLSSNMGDCAVKAIVLESFTPKELVVHPNAFAKMSKLRLLILRNVDISFPGPVYLLNELRWMEWAQRGPWIPEFSSGPKKLEGLDVSNCNITGVIKQFKEFQQLKYITLTSCHSMVSAPDLTYTPNIVELNISNCESLVEAHKSIADHEKLQVLDITWCAALRVFPNVSKNLRSLCLAFCPKLERFPDIPHTLEGLERLALYDIPIRELPASVENLVSLKEIELTLCRKLAFLSSNIYKLQNLQLFDCSSLIRSIRFPKYQNSIDSCMTKLTKLSLSCCELSEVEFLEDLSSFPLLKKLDLNHNNITSLPTSIGKRDHLSELHIDGCHYLQEIHELPPYLEVLHANRCYRLREIPELPPYLKRLFMSECKSLQSYGHLTSIDPWVRRGLTRFDTASLDQDSYCHICLPGREMPEWIQPIEGSSITFIASKDLYDKFLGLILCAVHYDKSLRKFEYEAHFNGKTWRDHVGNDLPPYFYGISLAYFPPTYLWKVVDFDQINGSYAQFSLKLFDEGMNKYGVRMIFKKLEDDLKVLLRDKQPIDPAFIYEVGLDSTPESSSPHMYKDSLIEIGLRKTLQESAHVNEDSPVEIDSLKIFQDYRMSIEEQTQIGSKRKRELILPQAKRIKTMLTPNSTTEDENEMRVIDLLKNLHL